MGVLVHAKTRRREDFFVIASKAKRSNSVATMGLDCFALLAMTIYSSPRLRASARTKSSLHKAGA